MVRTQPRTNAAIFKALGPAILLLLPLALALLPSRAAAASEEPKRVLLLFAEDPSVPFISILGQSIRSTLDSKATSRIEFYAEYLDRARITDEVYERELVNFWRKKYEGRKIDLIIVCVASAFDLLARHRAELFPGAPAVFCVIFEQQISGIKTAPNVTGVWSASPFRPTLDLVLRLHPDTRQVLWVTGSGEFDKAVLQVAKADLADFQNERVELDYLPDVTFSELQGRLATLPKHTIVIHVSFSRDSAGAVILTGPEIVSRIASSSNSPVYGTAHTVLGSGIVGGSLISFEDLGARAAEIGARILAGERPQDIAPQAVPNVLMFDWREMRRWGISERNLPPGGIVQFAVPSFWDEYKWRIIGVISLIILQSVLIVGLVINRVRRKRAEESLQQTQSELAHVGRVMITGELAATIAHEVNQPLTAMVANANATRRMLRKGNANPDEALEAIDDIVKDAHRASEVVGRIRSLLRKAPRRTEPLAINDVIEDVVAIARNDLVRKRVSLRTELAEGLQNVEADRVEIQQVMLNLVMNAVEAMRNVEDGSRNLLIRTARNESGSVLVELQDSGVGIASENLGRIFDAFYTTRKEGMGMGLSICRTIVEAHGGMLWAEVNKDRGATFRFTLRDATEGRNERAHRA